MCQIHIRVLLTTSFLLYLLLLSSPVSSKPAGSAISPTLGRPSTTTGTALDAYIPTNLPGPPPDAPLPSKMGDATSGINGMSIFWVIMPLFMACMTHPIGSACSLDAVYRHQIRIGPLMSLFDTLHLLYEIHHRYRKVGDGDSAISPIRSATREVVEMRLHRHRAREHDSGSNPQGGPRIATLLCRFERCVYNTPIRHLFSAVLILQYVKLCGFYGIPISFSLATGYFASWIIMETILLVGEGRVTMDPGGAALPTPDSSSPPITPKSAGGGAFLLQGITISAGTFALFFTQDGSKFAPKHGETVLISYVRWAILLSIPLSPMYWAEHVLLLAWTSRMSERRVSGHGSSGIAPDLTGLLVATIHASVITISAVSYHSWIMAGHLPLPYYLMFFYASRLFWLGRGGGEGREGCRAAAQPGPGLVFGNSAFTYVGGLLLFYVFVFNSKGTWKAGWTESLP